MAGSPVSGYVPYEDIQRDLGARRKPPRPRSLPNLPSEVCKAVTASAIAQVGGFRREHLHHKRHADGALADLPNAPPAVLPPQGFRRDSEHIEQALLREQTSSDHLPQVAAATMTPRQADAASKTERLLASINSNVAFMVSFYSSLGVTQAEDLFGQALPDAQESLLGEEPRGMTTTTTIIAILKAFVCTSVLYLPNAFAFGGWGSSLLLLTVAGFFCTLGLLLLAECHAAHSVSYAEMGRVAFGSPGYSVIATMLVLSQFGFCVSGHVLVARSLSGVAESYGYTWALEYFYLGQLPVFVPLGWIRRIAKMKVTNILGDVIVVGGLGIIVAAACCKVGAHGIEPNVRFFEGNWTSFIGTAVYSFEGIGVAIPIREAMLRPADFDKVMSGSVAMVAAILACVGLSGYLAWGPLCNPVVLNELPAGNGRTTLVVVYAVAVCFVYPLTIYPTFTIVEQRLFPQEFSQVRKWLKNLFRLSVTTLGVLLAYAAGEKIEFFVSVIGCVFAIPLALLVPPVLHRRMFPGKAPFRTGFLVVFGLVATVVCMRQNLASLLS